MTLRIGSARGLLLVAVALAAAGCSRAPRESISPTSPPVSSISAPPTQSPSPSPSSIEPTSPAADVETLAYLSGGEVWLIGADGTGQRRLGPAAVEAFSWIRASTLDVVSTDGRHLLVGLDGTSQDLPFPAGGSWSSDGGRYAVPVDERVVVYGADGNVQATLVAGPGECHASIPGGEPDRVVLGRPVFGPAEGAILAASACYSDGAATGNLSAPIYRVAIDGSANERLPNLFAELEPVPGLSVDFPRPSPDGESIVQLGRSHASICAETLAGTATDADGNDPRPVTIAELVDPPTNRGIFGGLVGFSWSPGSDSIAASFDASLCDRNFQPQPFVAGLYRVEVAGAGETELVEGPTHDPAWSPSGHLVAFVAGSWREGDPTAPIRLVDTSTGVITDLATGSAPAWQPSED